MDPLTNPFAPGAGSPPPELVGRTSIVEQTALLLARTKQRRPEKSFLMTGLRGVGKTVLLNELERMAEQAGYRTIMIEAHEDKPLGVMLAPHLRRALYDLDRMAGAGNKVKRGLAVLRGFIGAVKVKVGDVEFGLDIDPEKGTADTGDIEVDLPELFTVIGEAALDRKAALALLIDEVQYLGRKELSALIMAMHKMQQRQLPVVLVGAGLPTLPALAGDSKSYAERLFSFPVIGPLSASDTAKALQEAVLPLGVSFTKTAQAEVYKHTQGYPYFIQEWGYQAWNHATSNTIGPAVIEECTARVAQRLDENFFRVRFDRLTPAEKDYLRAMAHFGEGPHRSADVAAALGIKITAAGPVRDKLIKKGMIYSPAHGETAFTVPLFDAFMRRAMPVFKVKKGK